MKDSGTIRDNCPVLIIGAGPVGLLLANLLGKLQIPVFLAEQRTELPDWSRAIGVTPPSLEILKSVGIHEKLEEAGVCIEEALVHDDRGTVGRVGFSELDSEFQHILALPQCDTMRFLADNLARFSSVTVRRGLTLTGLKLEGENIVAEFDSGEVNSRTKLNVSWLVGCDGVESTVRKMGGINFSRRGYGQSFVMADYDDHTALGDHAHLYFKREGSVESFPLPGRRRRWVVLANSMPADADRAAFLERVVAARAGYSLSAGIRQSPVFQFTPECVVVDRLAAGRILLAGDAGHVISPIGGQGMNTGFADAELAATILPRLLADEEPETLLAVYNKVRSCAARSARRRAALAMWVGTRVGRISSAVRNLSLRALLKSPLAKNIPSHFAMLSIPYNRADKVNL